MFSSQKFIMRFQTGCSPFMKEYQRSVAHTAPPEVPLMLTNSNSSPNLALTQGLQRPRGEGGLAAAALAGDGDLCLGHEALS